MGRQPRPRRQSRMASLMAVASTASAMSLSSFQLITSSQVPLGCILAYNAAIPGCSTAADFTQGPQGNVCSAGCKRALQAVEDTLGNVCSGANVPPTSVLGKALSGALVELLCPSGKPTSNAPAQNVGLSSTAAVVITQTTRQIGTFSPIPTPSTAKITRSTSSSSLSTISEDDSATDTQTATSTSSEEADPEPTEATQTTQTAPPAPVITSDASTPTQATSAQQTTAPAQTTARRRPGGAGGPFEAVPQASGSRLLSIRSLEASLSAMILMFLLLR